MHNESTVVDPPDQHSSNSQSSTNDSELLTDNRPTSQTTMSDSAPISA